MSDCVNSSLRVLVKSRWSLINGWNGINVGFVNLITEIENNLFYYTTIYIGSDCLFFAMS